MTERKYAMTRVAAGDYLLPSNDGRRLWRLSRYHEHGDAEQPDGRGGWRPVVGDFWEAVRWDGTLAEADATLDRCSDVLEFLYDDRWVTFSTGHRTRREAVDSALEATTPA